MDKIPDGRTETELFKLWYMVPLNNSENGGENHMGSPFLGKHSLDHAVLSYWVLNMSLWNLVGGKQRFGHPKWDILNNIAMEHFRKASVYFCSREEECFFYTVLFI